MTSTLETNISALLTRAWERIEPRPEFEARLRRAFDEALAERAPSTPARGRTAEPAASAIPGPRPTRSAARARQPRPAQTERRRLRPVPLFAALAAALLVLFGARLLLVEDGADAGGDAFVRYSLGAPDAPEVTEVGDAKRVFEVGPAATWLSFAAQGRAVDVRAGESLLATLGTRPTQLEVEASGTPLIARLRAGQLDLDVSPSRPCELHAAGAVIHLEDAHARVTLPGPHAVLELVLDDGEAQVGDHQLRAGPRVWRLVAGVLQDAPPLIGSSTPSPARTPNGTEPGPPAPGAALSSPGPGETSKLARLAGCVVSASSGQPVTRYRVSLRALRPVTEVQDPVSIEVDDPTGAFEWPGLAVDRYRLVVQAESHAAFVLSELELTAAGPNEVLVELGEGHSLSGAIVDRETGAPIEGAHVIVQDLVAELVLPTHLDPGSLPVQSATSDSSGQWRIAHAPEGAHTLRISAAGYAPSWQEVTVASDRAAQTVPLVQLSAGGSVQGRIERRDGEPWAGALVIASEAAAGLGAQQSTYGNALADAQGRYRIDHLSPSVYVLLVPEDFMIDGRGRVENGFVQEGEVSVVDILGRSGGGRLSGTLRRANGTPISGSTVTLLHTTDDDWQSSSTDEQGRYQFTGLIEGPYELFVGEGATYADMTLAIEELTMERGEERVLDLTLSGGGLSGKLTIEGQTIQEGWAFLEVQAEPAGPWRFAARAQIGAGGAYRMPFLPSGRYRMTAVGEQPLIGQAFGAPFELAAEQRSERDLELERGGRITVQVLDADGEPVSGARVEVSDAQGRELLYHMTRLTDAEGRVRVMQAAAGSWNVQVQHPEHGRAQDEVRLRTDESRSLSIQLGE